MNARRARRQMLAVLLLGGLAGGCAAIVGFPDQTLADGGDGAVDAAATRDATNDGQAPTIDATASDATDDAPGSTAGDGSDAAGGSYCTTVDTAFCDDFEEPSPLTRWQLTVTADGGAASIVTADGVEGGDAGNHALSILLPDAAMFGQDVDEGQNKTDISSGTVRVAFYVMTPLIITTDPIAYLAQIDQNDHSLLLYLSGTSDSAKLVFQERTDHDGSADGPSVTSVDLTSWQRVEIVLTVTDAGPPSFTATVAGVPIGATNLASAWISGANQKVNFRLGNSYIEGGGQKTLLYDNVITDTK